MFGLYELLFIVAAAAMFFGWQFWELGRDERADRRQAERERDGS